MSNKINNIIIIYYTILIMHFSAIIIINLTVLTKKVRSKNVVI